jgi:hypothetical protein
MLDDLLNTPTAPAPTISRGGWSFTQEWTPAGDESTASINNTEELNGDIITFVKERGGYIPDSSHPNTTQTLGPATKHTAQTEKKHQQSPVVHGHTNSASTKLSPGNHQSTTSSNS